MRRDALAVNIVAKAYEGKNGSLTEAVAGLAFTAPAGQLTALIGPSGCGKTTALRIIAGLDTDYEGSVSAGQGSRIGFVFQEPRLLPWKTLDQNVRLPLGPGGKTADLGLLYAELGLTALENRFPGELSLGLARRVAIARALATEPEILILDEPSASLDEATAQKMRQLILSVVARYRPTTLLVTHNIREAIALADKLVLLAPRPGRVTGEMLLERPAAERDAAWVEGIRAELMLQYPGTVA